MMDAFSNLAMGFSAAGSWQNMGFALIGLAAGTAEGVQGVLVYMAIYMAMTLGTFACVMSMRREGGNVETILSSMPPMVSWD